MSNPPLILASSSPWRRQLLERLQLDFDIDAPDIDESAFVGENASALAIRLARTKTATVFERHPEAIVIGADQVADVNAELVGKPGSRARAIEQLQRQSGRAVYFQTGVCVMAPQLTVPLEHVETVVTRFRTLAQAEIERYVDSEDVTATAGSLKSEGLGITLVESVDSSDPSTLVGLPLIALRRMLAEAGLSRP